MLKIILNVSHHKIRYICTDREVHLQTRAPGGAGQEEAQGGYRLRLLSAVIYSHTGSLHNKRAYLNNIKMTMAFVSYT